MNKVKILKKLISVISNRDKEEKVEITIQELMDIYNCILSTINIPDDELSFSLGDEDD